MNRAADLVAEGAALLRAAGVDGADRAAAWWVAEFTQNDQTALDAATSEKIRAGFLRLAEHEPLQYVIGHAPFLDLSLRTDARALAPRPETEELVTRVLADRDFWAIPGRAVADVGTGTGCIAIALASKVPSAHIWAVDRSPDALALARENAARTGTTECITFVEGDLLASFAPASLDLVVSNPPYIARPVIVTLDETVRRYEPAIALDGGPDGLDIIRRLVDQSFTVLKKRGRVWLEIGDEQGDAVYAILSDAGFQQVTIHRDMYQHNRFAEAVT